MKRKPASLVLALLLCASGYGAVAAIASTPATIASGVAFELNANKIYVRVKVNRRGPFWFILDSGSPYNVLDNRIAKQLGLALRGDAGVRGAGDATVTSMRAPGVSLEFGGVELPSQNIVVLPLSSSLSGSEGRVVDGLLGYEFFSRYCLNLNYRDRAIDVFSPGTCVYSDRDRVDLDIERDALYVSGSLLLLGNERLTGRFLLDTGFRTALSLNRPFAGSNNLVSKIGPSIETTSGVGIGGETRGIVGRLSSLGLGNVEIDFPIVELSEMGKGVLASTNFSGIIGGDVLRRFNVVLDCSRHLLALERQSDAVSPFEFDMSGLFITAEGSDLRTFRVRHVLTDSPSFEGGIRENDFIEAVDGRTASQLTLEQICQTFKHRAGDRHLVKLKRADRQLATIITLRRMV